MLYAAKCYWPGVTPADLQQVNARAAQAGPDTSRDPVTYLGTLLFVADDLVLCMFTGPSRAAVSQASEHLRVPCERIMDATWITPSQPAGKGTPA